MTTGDVLLSRLLHCLCEVATSLTSAESAALYLREQQNFRLLAHSTDAMGKQRAETWLRLLRQQQVDDAFGQSPTACDEALNRLSYPGLAIRQTGCQEGDAFVLSRHDDSDLQLVAYLASQPEQSVAAPALASGKQVVTLLRAIRQVLDTHSVQNAEREKEMAEYLATLAHDLNNQFAVVLGYVHLLSEESASPDSTRRSIEVIREAMLAANSLVGPLLRNPQVVADDEVWIELDEWLRAEAPEIVYSAGVVPTLSLELSAPTAALLVSPSRLRRTLRLLIHRIMEIEPQRTMLRLWTETSALEPGNGSAKDLAGTPTVPTVRIGLTSALSVPTVDLSPESVSWPEGNLTTSALPDLALPLSHRFASTYGGNLTVSDDPETGRTAVMELPLARMDSTSVKETFERTPTATPLTSSLSVLVVDDDGNIRDFIQQILLGQNYSVTCCGTGAEAESLIAAGLNPDAVICDVVLPDGSGLHVMKQIAARTPATRWLFMSGYGAESLTGRGMLDPVIPFLSKPFNPDELTNKLIELLLEREAARQRTVLIVDDDAGIRELLRQILSAAGHHVFEAKNGKEAMATLENTSVDLLLTDLVMPTVDGTSLIKQARKSDPLVPIIAFSGSLAASERLAMATALGATAVVTKPLDLQALVKMIAECLQHG